MLDPTGERIAFFSQSNPEGARLGDILLVRQKDGDPFAGVLLSIRSRGPDTSILLRNELTRVGVEMMYKIYSPNIQGIELVRRKQGKRARRARLTYYRKPKHDLRSVESIVQAYHNARAALRSDGTQYQGKFGKKRKKGKR